MERKNIIFLIVMSIFFILLSVVAFSFAYFGDLVVEEESVLHATAVNLSTLEAVGEDNDNLFVDIYPGWAGVQKLSLFVSENTPIDARGSYIFSVDTDIDVGYEDGWLTYEVYKTTNPDFNITITKGEETLVDGNYFREDTVNYGDFASGGGEEFVVSGIMKSSDTNITLETSNYTGDMPNTYYYIVYKFLNLDVNQNSVMDKEMNLSLRVDVDREQNTLAAQLGDLPTKLVNVNGREVNKVYGNAAFRTSLNNYVWYSGHLWQIMEVNDRTVKMITADSVTNISYGYQSDFNTSWVNKWLVNEFYANLVNKSILVDTKFCVDTIDSSKITATDYSDGSFLSKKLSAHQKITSCTNEITSKVGLLTFEDYIYAYDAENPQYDASNFIGSEELVYTMTPYDADNLWTTWYNGSEYITYSQIYSNTDTYALSVRPVVTIKSDTLITGGTGFNNNPYVVKEPTASVGSFVNNINVGDFVYLDESNNPFYYYSDQINKDVAIPSSKDKVRYRVVDINEDGSIKVQRTDILRNMSDDIAIAYGSFIPYYCNDADCFEEVDSGCYDNNYYKPLQGFEEYVNTEGENIGYFLNNATNSFYNWFGPNTKNLLIDREVKLDTSGYGNDYSNLDNDPSTAYPYVTNDGNVTATVFLPSWGDMFAANNINFNTLLMNRWQGSDNAISFISATGSGTSAFASLNYGTIRPVVNINNLAKVASGTGTMLDPYSVYMN